MRPLAPYMVSVSHISRTFGRKTALDDVSFSLKKGDTALLSGPNGAGKTTLLRILAGYAPASRGSGTIDGRDLFLDDTPSRDLREIVGYVPESVPLPDDMLVGEYLRFRGRLHGIYGSALRRSFGEVVELCGLGELRATPLARLSRGARVRAALAAALLHRPSVLLLDDPLAAIDTAQRLHLVSALRNAAGVRTTILATHTPDDAARLFTRVLLLANGRLVFNTPLDPNHPPLSLGATVTGWLLDMDN